MEKLLPDFVQMVDLFGNNVNIEIAERIRQARAERPQGATTVVLYGALHFTGKDDIDEQLAAPGRKSVSVGVVEAPGLSAGVSPHGDLPDYVWYESEQRLARLDSDAAKAEFLGVSLAQYTEYMAAVEGLGEALAIEHMAEAENGALASPMPQHPVMRSARGHTPD